MAVSMRGILLTTATILFAAAAGCSAKTETSGPETPPGAPAPARNPSPPGLPSPGAPPSGAQACETCAPLPPREIAFNDCLHIQTGVVADSDAIGENLPDGYTPAGQPATINIGIFQCDTAIIDLNASYPNVGVLIAITTVEMPPAVHNDTLSQVYALDLAASEPAVVEAFKANGFDMRQADFVFDGDAAVNSFSSAVTGDRGRMYDVQVPADSRQGQGPGVTEVRFHQARGGAHVFFDKVEAHDQLFHVTAAAIDVTGSTVEPMALLPLQPNPMPAQVSVGRMDILFHEPILET